MTNPTIRIHNLETNEIVDRPMTDEEFEQYEADLEASMTYRAEMEALKS